RSAPAASAGPPTRSPSRCSPAALPVLEVSVRDQTVSGLGRSGWQLHGPLFLLLAAIAAACAIPAVRGSLAAALGIAATGAATVLAVALGDGPDIGATGLVPGSLAQGTASAGPGVYIAILAGVLLLLTGGLLALRSYEG
ncbi:MAG: hypothetical protein ACKOK7_06645, partial [Solirubrobacterales bacterium]